MISVAAELAEMHPQTLRMYEQRGLIEPKRSPKGTRLYSHEDVDRLRRIQEMTNDLGLNLAGVEHVLRLEQELDRARAASTRWSAAPRSCRPRWSPRSTPSSARCAAASSSRSSTPASLLPASRCHRPSPSHPPPAAASRSGATASEPGAVDAALAACSPASAG